MFFGALKMEKGWEQPGSEFFCILFRTAPPAAALPCPQAKAEARGTPIPKLR